MTSSGSISDVIGGQETPGDGGNDTGHTGGGGCACRVRPHVQLEPGISRARVILRAYSNWWEGDTVGHAKVISGGTRSQSGSYQVTFQVIPDHTKGHSGSYEGHSRSYRVSIRVIPVFTTPGSNTGDSINYTICHTRVHTRVHTTVHTRGIPGLTLGHTMAHTRSHTSGILYHRQGTKQ